ncbi:hypothetical protein T02_3048 [Trichinella nativa]|uniref:Uncharacterized protein n=1 Tax=Trichinella nativa TaxID=6335 RepID=A0A0V1KYE8_9BILA|nr:hypothetical protein T02_3048 [Trichinella nativa]
MAIHLWTRNVMRPIRRAPYKICSRGTNGYFEDIQEAHIGYCSIDVTYLNFGISMIACDDDQLLLVKMPFSDLASNSDLIIEIACDDSFRKIDEKECIYTISCSVVNSLKRVAVKLKMLQLYNTSIPVDESICTGILAPNGGWGDFAYSLLRWCKILADNGNYGGLLSDLENFLAQLWKIYDIFN